MKRDEPTPTGPRVCRLDDCGQQLPPGAHARQKYCNDGHRQIAALRRLEAAS